MKIVNGVRIFTLEFSEAQLNLFNKYLANQEYIERATLLQEINHQLGEQQKLQSVPAEGGRFATEMARECSPEIA
jgi:hypothetical protein